MLINRTIINDVINDVGDELHFWFKHITNSNQEWIVDKYNPIIKRYLCLGEINKLVDDNLIGEVLDRVFFRRLLHQNVFVAGGALKSLLYGEEPNDYDIYFKNKEVAKLVSEIIRLSNNLPIKFDGGESDEPRDENLYQVQIADCLVDMGFDASLMMPRGQHYIIPNETMLLGDDLEDRSDHLPRFISFHTITILDGKVQLIFSVINEDPKEVIKNFDFKHTQIIYDVEDSTLHVNDDLVYQSLLTKKLIFTGNTLLPFSSLHRMMKFKEQGFTTNYSEELKLAMSINLCDISDVSSFIVQIMGMDIVFIHNILDDIEKVKGKGSLEDMTPKERSKLLLERINDLLYKGLV